MRLALFAAVWLAATPALAQGDAKPANLSRNNAAANVDGAANVLIPGTNAGQSDSCLSPGSAGFGNTAFGVAFNYQLADHSCVRIRKAKMRQQLGLATAAVQVMCAIGDLKAAMVRAGTPGELQTERQ